MNHILWSQNDAYVHLNVTFCQLNLMLYLLQIPPLTYLIQIKALFSFREATTFQKAWKSIDVTAAEEVRALPDIVGKSYFP